MSLLRSNSAAAGSASAAAGSARARDRVNLPITVALASFAIIAINMAAVFRITHKEHEKAIASTIRDNSNLVIAFEQHITRTLGIADSLTLLLKREFARDDAQLSLEWLTKEEVFDSHLIHAASIIREDGTLLASTDRWDRSNPSPANIARELAFHADTEQSNNLHVGVPENTPSSSAALIPISRRLNRPDGSFAGIALLAVESVRFTDFYDQVPRRPHDLMLLLGLDGIVRARQSGANHSAGETVPLARIFAHAVQTETGDFISASPLDGVRRFVSYSRLKQFPLLVAVGVSEEDALADVTHRSRGVHLSLRRFDHPYRGLRGPPHSRPEAPRARACFTDSERTIAPRGPGGVPHPH